MDQARNPVTFPRKLFGEKKKFSAEEAIAELRRDLGVIAEEKAAETRTGEEASEILGASELEAKVEFKSPVVTRQEFNDCKEILKKLKNKTPLTRPERRRWDRLLNVVVEKDGVTSLVRQTGNERKNNDKDRTRRGTGKGG